MELARQTVTLGSLVLAMLAAACSSGGSSGSSTTEVTINELQPSNTVTIADPADAKYNDWLEIYNSSDKEFDLAGYFLTDDSSDLKKFTFTTNAAVPAKGFLIVWADGVDQVTQGPLHAGFKLSASAGDRVILSDPDGYVVDDVPFTIPTVAESAYGRFPDGTGEFAWCSAPTPGTTNGAACAK